MQLLLILLRYDSRMHYFAGSKNVEVVSSSIFCAEWRCMCIKCTCVIHILALINLVKCLLYRITESDPLARTSNLNVITSVEGRKSNVVLSPGRSLSFWASVWCILSLGLLLLQQVVWPRGCCTKRLYLCQLLKESHDFLLHSVGKLSGLAVTQLRTAQHCQGREV